MGESEMSRTILIQDKRRNQGILKMKLHKAFIFGWKLVSQEYYLKSQFWKVTLEKSLV